QQGASASPARMPPALQAFAAQGVTRLLRDPGALACALGEVLSEPKRGVWFDSPDVPPDPSGAGLRLDRRSRMLYDNTHVYLNGESFRAGGRDATLMRRLADRRRLGVREQVALSAEARALVADWLDAGWLVVE
ncbi:MAG: cupin domain-containing protein, partial [Pseudomonadota bacterium]|nr:cupin domain-containing protein [Pseudomonadota bacterium]